MQANDPMEAAMEATYEILNTAAVSPLVNAFARDVLEGLSRSPKCIPSVHFYDAVGSRLFQQITELPEYYLTRCEQEILDTHGPQIVARVYPRPFRLVELGVGDGRKTETLLHHFLQAGLEFEYVPVDICRQTIAELSSALRRKFRDRPLLVRGMVAEYFDALRSLGRQNATRNFVLFLGSNIGNFTHPEARRFIGGVRQSLHAGDYALIGFDLKKDVETLCRAYNDSDGITRQFNLNLLDRINRELGGRFDRRLFMHYGDYNVRQGCMESWLISTEDQAVPIAALNRTFDFHAWEAVHVECSYKYDLAQIENLAASNGFSIRQHFFDGRRQFVDSLWQAE
jgi:L-histidine Nalpha-methyltransferase